MTTSIDDLKKTELNRTKHYFTFQEKPDPQLLLEILSGLTEEKSVILASLDKNLCFTFFNREYHDEMQNLTGKDICIGMCLLDAYDNLPELQKISNDIWTRALNGEEINQTHDFGDPDGYHRFYIVNVAPIHDSRGKITGARTIATNITEKLKAETALHESEQRYASLFNSMSEGFVLNEIICDETGQPVDYRFLDINPAFEKLTGFSREVIVGKTHNEVIPNDIPDWVEKYGRVALTGEPQHFEVHSPTQNRDYEAFTYCPAPGQFASIFSDVTVRKKAEETRNWLASFPEMNPQIIMVVEFNRDITYINPAGKKLFPDYQGNMYEHPFLSGSEAIMERFLNGELGSINREVAINNTWYKQTWVNLPEFSSVRIYSMDITDQKEAERALQDANKELEEKVRLRTKELSKANQELHQDIARRIETEKALKIEKQRFTDVLEILPVYLILLTPDYHVAFANRYFREHFGEADGRPCYEYIFGRSQPCENCETRKVLGEQNSHHWVWKMPNEHIYNVFEFPFTDSDGSPLILEMGIDITEVHEAQDRLRDLNNYNRSLIEANLDILVTITPEGKIGDVNAATEAVTGYCREELIGTDFLNYFTDPQKALAGYQQVFRTGTVRDYELEIQHKDGHITPVAYNASVYHDEDGNVIGIFASARDLTELKCKENELIQLNTALEKAIEQEHHLHNQLVLAEKFAAMGRMLASITHEINNPLQTIKNCLYLIQGDILPDSRANQFLDMASSETERISNLVAQLREIYRPRQEGQLLPFSLTKVLDDVNALLNSHLQNGHVQWVQSTAIKDPLKIKINGIEDQIKQVFINLVMNAIDAMQPGGGKIFIDIIESKITPQVGVIFHDSGPGITSEHLARIFEPFFSTKNKGLGLGLWISYDIIQKHGGQIHVKSEPGQGATFEVWLTKMDD